MFQWVFGFFSMLDAKTKKRIIDTLVELSSIILKSMWDQRQKSKEGK